MDTDVTSNRWLDLVPALGSSSGAAVGLILGSLLGWATTTVVLATTGGAALGLVAGAALRGLLGRPRQGRTGERDTG